jgi:hypothetical protein
MMLTMFVLLSFHAQAAEILVITVYRTPWASVADTISLCDLLDELIVKHPSLIMVGDFNLPGVQWSADSTQIKVQVLNIFITSLPVTILPR